MTDNNKIWKRMPSVPAGHRRQRCPGSTDVKYITGEENAIRRKLHLTKRGKNQELKIATWNVRSLKKKGKLDNTLQEMKRLNIDILGISEVKFSDNGRIERDDATIFFSGKPSSEKNHHYGIGVIVTKEVSRFVINFIPYSDRCMMLQFDAHPLKLNILQVYAPTSQSSEQELEDFYKDIEELLDSTKSQDINIILGDMNAKVGEGAVYKIVGNYGLGERNERGDRLVQFCAERDFIITNTWYQHPPRRLYTWTSPLNTPDNIIKNQIDYILVPTRYRNSIKSVRTYPGADIGSDHNPLIAKMNLKLKNNRKNNISCKKLNIEKLKHPTVKEFVKNKLELEMEKSTNNRYHNETVSDKITIEKEWNDLKELMLKVSKENLGYQGRSGRLAWITDDILQLMENRRQSKSTNLVKYKELDNTIKQEIRKARDLYLLSRCQTIERLQDKHDSFNLHKEIKEFTKTNRKRIQGTLVNSKNKLVTSHEDQCKTWEEYIETLFHDDRTPNQLKDQTDHELEGPPILLEEISRALTSMKDGKAVGPDGIHAEILKLVDDSGFDRLRVLFNKIYDSEIIPEDWLKSTFLPLPKKANAKSCSDHRLISLMSHALKVFLKIIFYRINPKIESSLSPSQFGFRNGLGTREALVAIQVLIQKCLEFRKSVFICFIDFEKAFDNVKHDKLMGILKLAGIDTKDLNIIRNLYWNQTAHIKTGQSQSRDIRILKGVRQGCIMSPALFNAYSESIFQEAFENIDIGVKVNGEIINNIRYADDTALLAHTIDDLQILLDRLNVVVNDYGLKMNVKKTKYMVVSKLLSDTGSLIVEGKPIERVKQYRYLGCLLNENWKPDAEIRTRIEIARSTFMRMKYLFLNRNIGLKLRWRMVKCYVLSILMHGVEGWTLSSATERKLNAFEMWLYRRMLRISWRDRVRNVEVLRRMFNKKLELLITVKKRKVAYFGHIHRHTKYNLLKLIIEGKMDGKRGRGRKRIAWCDNIKSWTGTADAAALSRAAQDRKVFKEMVADIR